MAKIVFSIYVSGAGSRSAPSANAFKEACDQYLEADTFQINFIDISKETAMAETKKILAIPTIVKEIPAPERRVIGDVRSPEKALKALEFLMDDVQFKK